ncbi:MAG: CHRD domain-containing protein [Azonexus sp.]|nr:CHRD domain-containing protein [Azonexus sp.]MDZ4315658.1 CHRD domain-containing protein [Azonexus sp.]
MLNQSFRTRLFSRIAPLALIFLASTNLYAQEPISVSLTGSTVVPPVMTTARGTGQFTITPNHVVIGSIKTFGLAPTMVHIHEAPAGKNGPVIVTLGKTADDSYAVPPNTKLNDAQYASFLAGNLYVHVHTAQHPDGELRAQLLPLKAGEKPKGSY